MLKRFEDEEGRRRLITILATQTLVRNDPQIAHRLAEAVEVDEFDKGKQLYASGETGKNLLLLVLSGAVSLSADGRPIAALKPGDFVGEFPVLDPSLNYAVSVTVDERSMIASLSEEQLRSIARDHPAIWENMARELAFRLRSRTRAERAGVINPAALTLTEILKALTVPQIAAIIAALVAMIGVAYKVGAP